MNILLRSLGSALCIFAGILVGPAWAGAASLVIEDVTVIDGTGAQPVPHLSVLVVDKRIERVIPGLFDDQVKTGARVIDGRGKYLMPGLMDVHVHLTGAARISKDGLVKMPVDHNAGKAALHSYLYSGVTTIYDVGNDPGYIYKMRDRERAGKMVSPRILATGAIVTYPGSHGSFFEDSTVDRWPEAILTLDKHIALKPDMVKFTFEERGWGARPLIPILPLDLLQNLIQYYNDHGIRTTVHTSSERRARQAIFAGIDTLAHPVIQGPITPDYARVCPTHGGEAYSDGEHPDHRGQLQPPG